MNIYVGNLPPEITEDDLRQEFVTFGTVTSVTLMSDHGIGSGQGRGCGYVEMPFVKEGESAIEQLQGKSIKGRHLDIIKALPISRNANTEQDGDSAISGFSRKSRYWGGKTRRA
jgi:RNA recognition motif-containing protein